MELETDKVTVEIAAPASGTLIEVLKAGERRSQPGRGARALEPGGRIDGARGCRGPRCVRGAARRGAAGKRRLARGAERRRGMPNSESLGAAAAARTCASRRGEIDGTGRDGRVTAQDVTRHVAQTAPASADAATRVSSCADFWQGNRCSGRRREHACCAQRHPPPRGRAHGAQPQRERRTSRRCSKRT